MKLRLQNSWMFIAFFIGFFLFWEYAVIWFDIPRYILTPPSLIIEKGAADLDRLLYYTYVTGVEVVLGYSIAIILALPLGLAIAFSSILKRTIYPFIVCIEMVPKIAFAPLFISWLGFGLLPKYFDEIIGKTVVRDIKKFEPVRLEDINEKVLLSVLEDAYNSKEKGFYKKD